MRVLLIQPPSPGPRIPGQTVEPLALESLAAALDDCEVVIADLRFDRRPLDAIMAAHRPDVVALGPVTVQVHGARRLLREVKRIDPGVLTVVGGHHASALPQDFALPSVDVIVLGMGEQPLRELVAARRARRALDTVAGLVLPGPEGLRRTAPRAHPSEIESLPPPRRDLTAAYRRHYRSPWGGPMVLISTSRGCPYRCAYCSIWSFSGGRFLARSPAAVLRELAAISTATVRWADGNTFGDPRRMVTLAGLLAEARLDHRYMMDLRSDLVVRERALMETWAGLGLRFAALGLESVEDRRLEQLNKSSAVADHEAALRILRDLGVQVIGQFMVDPDFTPDDFARLAEFVERHEIAWPIFFITTPLPGTPLFAARQHEILTSCYDYFDLIHPVLPTALPRARFWDEFLGLYRRVYRFTRLRRTAPWHRALLMRAILEVLAFGGRREHELTRAGEPDTVLAGRSWGRAESAASHAEAAGRPPVAEHRPV